MLKLDFSRVMKKLSTVPAVQYGKYINFAIFKKWGETFDFESEETLCRRFAKQINLVMEKDTQYLIHNQSSNVWSAVGELLSNSIDATIEGHKIGKFGIGFKQVLKELYAGATSVIVVTKTEPNKYAIAIEFLMQDGKVCIRDTKIKRDCGVEQRDNGTYVVVKRKLALEEVDEIKKYIVEKYEYCKYLRIEVNGEVINSLKDVMDVNGECIIHTEQDKSVETLITKNGYAVIDNGKGMPDKIMYEKFLLPRQSTKKAYAALIKGDEILYKVGSRWGSKGKIKFVVGGVVIEQHDVTGIRIPEEIIIYLPYDTELSSARNCIVVSKRLILDIQSIVDSIFTGKNSPENKMILLNQIVKIVNVLILSARSGKEEKLIMEELKGKICKEINKLFSKEIVYLPESDGYEHVDVGTANCIYVHPDIYMQTAVESIPGIYKIQSFNDIKNIAYCVKFKESSRGEDRPVYFQFGNIILLDEKIYNKYKNNLEILNLMLNFWIGYGEKPHNKGIFQNKQITSKTESMQKLKSDVVEEPELEEKNVGIKIEEQIEKSHLEEAEEDGNAEENVLENQNINDILKEILQSEEIQNIKKQIIDDRAVINFLRSHVKNSLGIKLEEEKIKRAAIDFLQRVDQFETFSMPVIEGVTECRSIDKMFETDTILPAVIAPNNDIYYIKRGVCFKNKKEIFSIPDGSTIEKIAVIGNDVFYCCIYNKQPCVYKNGEFFSNMGSTESIIFENEAVSMWYGCDADKLSYVIYECKCTEEPSRRSATFHVDYQLNESKWMLEGNMYISNNNIFACLKDKSTNKIYVYKNNERFIDRGFDSIFNFEIINENLYFSGVCDKQCCFYENSEIKSPDFIWQKSRKPFVLLNQQGKYCVYKSPEEKWMNKNFDSMELFEVRDGMVFVAAKYGQQYYSCIYGCNGKKIFEKSGDYLALNEYMKAFKQYVMRNGLRYSFSRNEVLPINYGEDYSRYAPVILSHERGLLTQTIVKLIKEEPALKQTFALFGNPGLSDELISNENIFSVLKKVCQYFNSNHEEGKYKTWGTSAVLPYQFIQKGLISECWLKSMDENVCFDILCFADMIFDKESFDYFYKLMQFDLELTTLIKEHIRHSVVINLRKGQLNEFIKHNNEILQSEIKNFDKIGFLPETEKRKEQIRIKARVIQNIVFYAFLNKDTLSEIDKVVSSEAGADILLSFVRQFHHLFRLEKITAKWFKDNCLSPLLLYQSYTQPQNLSRWLLAITMSEIFCMSINEIHLENKMKIYSYLKYKNSMSILKHFNGIMEETRCLNKRYFLNEGFLKELTTRQLETVEDTLEDNIENRDLEHYLRAISLYGDFRLEEVFNYSCAQQGIYQYKYAFNAWLDNGIITKEWLINMSKCIGDDKCIWRNIWNCLSNMKLEYYNFKEVRVVLERLRLLAMATSNEELKEYMNAINLKMSEVEKNHGPKLMSRIIGNLVPKRNRIISNINEEETLEKAKKLLYVDDICGVSSQDKRQIRLAGITYFLFYGIQYIWPSFSQMPVKTMFFYGSVFGWYQSKGIITEEWINGTIEKNKDKGYEWWKGYWRFLESLDFDDILLMRKDIFEKCMEKWEYICTLSAMANDKNFLTDILEILKESYPCKGFISSIIGSEYLIHDFSYNDIPERVRPLINFFKLGEIEFADKIDGKEEQRMVLSQPIDVIDEHTLKADKTSKLNFSLPHVIAYCHRCMNDKDDKKIIMRNLKHGLKQRCELSILKSFIRTVRSVVVSQSGFPDLWIREIIQNSRDAVRKSIKTGAVGDDLFTISISNFIEREDDNKIKLTTIIGDKVGMNLDIIVRFLLMPECSDPEKKLLHLTGKFGMGFFTIFRDAHAVEIRTGDGTGKSYLIKLKVVRSSKEHKKNSIKNIEIEYIKEFNDAYKGTQISHIKQYDKYQILFVQLEKLRIESKIKRFISGMISDAFAYRAGEKQALERNEKFILEYQGRAIKVAQREIYSNVPIDCPLTNGKLGYLNLYKSPCLERSIVEQDGLLVSELNSEILEFVPDLFKEIIGETGVVIALPSGVELDCSRGGVSYQHSKIIKKAMFILYARASVYAYIQKDKNISALPNDFFRTLNMPVNPEIESIAKKINDGDLDVLSEENLKYFIDQRVGRENSIKLLVQIRHEGLSMGTLVQQNSANMSSQRRSEVADALTKMAEKENEKLIDAVVFKENSLDETKKIIRDIVQWVYATTGVGFYDVVFYQKRKNVLANAGSSRVFENGKIRWKVRFNVEHITDWEKYIKLGNIVSLIYDDDNSLIQTIAHEHAHSIEYMRELNQCINILSKMDDISEDLKEHCTRLIKEHFASQFSDNGTLNKGLGSTMKQLRQAFSKVYGHDQEISLILKKMEDGYNIKYNFTHNTDVKTDTSFVNSMHKTIEYMLKNGRLNELENFLVLYENKRRLVIGSAMEERIRIEEAEEKIRQATEAREVAKERRDTERREKEAANLKLELETKRREETQQRIRENAEEQEESKRKIEEETRFREEYKRLCVAVNEEIKSRKDNAVRNNNKDYFILRILILFRNFIKNIFRTKKYKLLDKLTKVDDNRLKDELILNFYKGKKYKIEQEKIRSIESFTVLRAWYSCCILLKRAIKLEDLHSANMKVLKKEAEIEKLSGAMKKNKIGRLKFLQSQMEIVTSCKEFKPPDYSDPI